MMKIAIGSDHGGFELKAAIIKHLNSNNIETTDCGAYTPDAVDYPDIAVLVCGKVLSGECTFGILVCGTGIGMSMAANKTNGIRAAVCHSEYDAQMTREHNDANVLCLGQRTTDTELAITIVDAFVDGVFQGGRHKQRVDKVMALENSAN